MLIACPECGNKMSDLADACPKCGWVPGKREAIEEHHLRQRAEAFEEDFAQRQLARKQRNRRIGWIVFLSLAAIAFVAALVSKV